MKSFQRQWFKKFNLQNITWKIKVKRKIEFRISFYWGYRIDPLISIYLNIDSISTKKREDYYGRCGFKGINLISAEEFIEFKSKDGLKTRAYNPEYVLNLLKENNYKKADAKKFAEIGMAYFGGLS